MAKCAKPMSPTQKQFSVLFNLSQAQRPNRSNYGWRKSAATLDNVIKAVIYLTDMKDFDIVSPIRDEYFKNSMPVSTMVEVSRMTLDGAKIEIEVTALLMK
jgi:enamine deaminase RidA (YjgF/YER057c/UK114 family)